jgi:hypothetical protein
MPLIVFAIMFDRSVRVKVKFISLNGRWFVTTGPVSPDPGWDEDPAGRAGEPGEIPGEGWRELPPPREDWLTEDEWAAQVACAEPEWFGAGEDPSEEPSPGRMTPPGTGKPRPGRAGGGNPGTASGSSRPVKEAPVL